MDYDNRNSFDNNPNPMNNDSPRAGGPDAGSTDGEYRYTSGSIHQDAATTNYSSGSNVSSDYQYSSGHDGAPSAGEGGSRFSYDNLHRDAAASGPEPYATVSEETPGRKPHKMSRKGKIALVTAAALLLSVGSGFGGAMLASRMGLANNGTVLYQSVNGTATSANTSANSVSGVVAKVQDSVVAITTEGISTNYFYQQYVTQGAGSGVIVSQDGYIVTNNHVVSGAKNITVTLNNGTTYTAKVVGTDSDKDIAVIKIEATGLTPAVLGDSDSIAVGDYVLAIGNPLGTLSGTVTDGIISALSREVTIDNHTMSLLQTSAAVNPGNSGGGLFNASGELVGIVNAKSSSDSSGAAVDNIGFAIPVNSVKNIISDLISKGYVSGRIVLGINLVEVNDQTAAYYKLSRTGVYIQSVQSGSIAELGGLKAGDCVLSFNGTEINKSSDLTGALEKCTVGQKVEVKVARDGQEYTLSLTLTEYVPSTAQN